MSACARASRGGLVVPITGFDLDLRRAIVTRRADQAQPRFGVHFPPAVLDYISRIVVSHGRDLDGAVNRLVAANQLTNEPITVAAGRAHPGRPRPGPRSAPRPHRGHPPDRVAPLQGAAQRAAVSSRRSRDVVRPRQIAMYLAKSLTSRSLPEIGRRFGGRDHTTVLHSVRKVEQMMKDDADLTQEIELLKRMLEE